MELVLGYLFDGNVPIFYIPARAFRAAKKPTLEFEWV